MDAMEGYEASPDEPTLLGLDQTHTWPDGLEVSVSEFERWNEGDLGYSDSEDYASFKVTFANGGEAPVTIDRIVRGCIVGGVEEDYEAFEHLASDWPSMIQPGSEGLWEPACPTPPEGTEFQFHLDLYATPTTSTPPTRLSTSRETSPDDLQGDAPGKMEPHQPRGVSVPTDARRPLPRFASIGNSVPVHATSYLPAATKPLPARAFESLIPVQTCANPSPPDAHVHANLYGPAESSCGRRGKPA
ncbi:MAG TPA: hypothetical protein VKZ89_17380 [Thermobifida alba]|nr:hypothetical protein [Thermobifida alba]